MRIDVTGQYGFSTLAIGVGEGGEALKPPGEGAIPTIRRLTAKIGVGEGGRFTKHALLGATVSDVGTGEGGEVG